MSRATHPPSGHSLSHPSGLPASASWPRRSASSSTAWTVEATIRSGDVPPRTQPREGEVAEPAMLTA